jgi:hypothetical protein
MDYRGIESSGINEQQLQPFLEGVPRLYKEYTERDGFPDSVRNMISKVDELSKQYSPEGQLLIRRQKELAVVATQYNSDPRKRFRRFIPPGQEGPTAAVTHSMEVTLKHMGHAVGIPIERESGDRFMIRAQQDPYDEIMITADLGHDLVEDVEGIEGIGEINDSGMWNGIMGEYLRRGPGGREEEVPRQMVQDVLGVVWAVTKPSDTEVAEIAPYIANDPFMRELLIHLQRHTDPAKAQLVPRQMIEAVASMHTLLDRTMGNKLQRLRSTAVKANDGVWNLNTPGTNKAKMHRAHTIAGGARFLGLPDASLLAIGLMRNNYSIGDDPGAAGVTPGEWEMLKEYVAVEDDRASRKRDGREMPYIRVGNEETGYMTLPVKANQIPITTLGERLRSPKRIDPAVQFLVSVTDPDIMRKLQISDNIALSFDGQRPYSSVRMNSHILEMMSPYQGMVYFDAEDQDSGKTAFICRFDDGQPTGHDVLKFGSTVSAEAVPALRLLDDVYNGTPQSTVDLCRELSPLAS